MEEAATRDEDADDPHRLTPEELAFLLRYPVEQAGRVERNSRSNARRTERRHSDPAYAERLRLADRERQRRRRAKAAIGRPEPKETPPVRLQRYVACFVAYRIVAATTGRRPIRGALTAVFKSRFGLQCNPAQLQKLRDRVERSAGAGGPWHSR